jgi:hypothetical protein
MLMKVGTAAALCAAFVVAAAMPAWAQNGNGATRGSGYNSSRNRPPRQTVQPQQDTGSSTFDPPPNSLGQPMTDTMSKPFNRTVGAPFGR